MKPTINQPSLFFWILLFICNTVFSQENNDSIPVKKHKVNLTGIPMVSYNKSYGFIGGVRGMGFFNVNEKDTISPASLAGIALGYTENKSWFGSAFSQLYFNEDTWRITAAVGLGKINFQYFDASGSDEGNFVDYSNVTDFYYLKGMRKIIPHFYAGALLKIQRSEVVFESAPDSTTVTHANGFGVSVLYDSRNNIYSPTKGWKSEITFVSNAKWMGSDELFNSIRAYANYYLNLNEIMVLASRVSMFSGLGNVPFTGQHSVGGKDIRGYTEGKYRGEQVYALQSEYRWNFYKRWGAVGFMGLAFTEKPYSGVLPGGGLGLRFRAIPSRSINIGLDYAIGKGDNGIYFRINEAF